jgi:hypothetical protein
VEKRGPEHKIDLKTHKAAMVDWRPSFLVLLAMAKMMAARAFPVPCRHLSHPFTQNKRLKHFTALPCISQINNANEYH